MPQYGVGALLVPVLAIAAIVAFASPVAGVLLLIATIPLDNLIVVGDQITWTRTIGLVVVFAWISRKLIRQESWTAVLFPNFLKPAFLFILLAGASILWAEHFPSTVEKLLTTVQLLGLSLLVVGIIDSWRRLEWALRVVILSGLFTSVLTIWQSFGQGFVRAGEGLAGNVNQTAAVLVLLLPFGFHLLRMSPSRLWRLVGLAFVAIAPLAVILTFSRTSLVFLVVLLGLQMWDMFKERGKDRVVMVAVGVILGVVLLASAPWDKVLERGSSISPAIQGVRGEDNRLQSSRIHHWLGAVAIFNDYPLLGAGYGNFGYQFLDYQFSVSPKYVQRIYGIHDKLRSPHSTFFGILAELGLVGTALWFWLLIAAFLDIRKSWTVSSRAPTSSQKGLVKAVFYSLLASTMFGFLIITHLDKLLWVLLGLSAVLRRLTDLPDERAAHEAGSQTIVANSEFH